MFKRFVKENAWFLLTSLALLGILVVEDFFYNNNYIKYGALAMWAFNTFVSYVYISHSMLKKQAKQCDTCNLFVPLQDDTEDKLKPHCCYMKPKGP